MMNLSDENHLREFFMLEYNKAYDISMKLEATKLAYQKFFMILLTSIVTVSIGFLNINIACNGSFLNELLTLDNLVGFLLLMGSLIGFIIIQNLVSVRRQAVFFNNSVIFLRNKVLHQYNIKDKYPVLQEVETTHSDSADFITILLFSVASSIMSLTGIMLIIKHDTINSFTLGIVMVIALILHSTVFYKYIFKKLKHKL